MNTKGVTDQLNYRTGCCCNSKPQHPQQPPTKTTIQTTKNSPTPCISHQPHPHSILHQTSLTLQSFEVSFSITSLIRLLSFHLVKHFAFLLFPVSAFCHLLHPLPPDLLPSCACPLSLVCTVAPSRCKYNLVSVERGERVSLRNNTDGIFRPHSLYLVASLLKNLPDS